ncbi:MAG TPA: chloride channel protein [Candidatus Limnocylindrales bacterium]|nr:chloride channel protein [Candidatus Limnocylindrales bacterium]
MTNQLPEPSRATALAYLRLVVLGALIGVPAAVAAAVFLGLIHALERWLWEDLPAALGFAGPPWFLILGLPVAGALLVIVARTVLAGDGGHAPLEGLSAKETPPAHVPSVVLAAIGSLAFGAVLGPEMPVIALGSAVGVAVNRFVTLGPRERAVISSAGSFSAVSALFGGPLVAGMLLIEGGLSAGSALIPLLLPGLVAAGLGYLVFVGFGSWEGLDAPGLQVPSLPPYEGVNLGDLGLAIVVGIAAALVLAGVRAVAHRLEDRQAAVGPPVMLLAGGLAVGALALAGQALGANSQDVLFSGQASLGVVTGASSASLVVVLLATKALAYAVSLGSGFRGGPIFPAIFVGVALASLPVVAFGSSPTWAIAVGSAAGMAAHTRLLISPLLLASLLVGPAGADTIPAAVLATSAGWIVATALSRRREVATAG